MRRNNRRRKALPKEPQLFAVSKLSHEGRGISHLDGKVVFIEGALPEEEVSALYTLKKQSFDEAKCLEVLQSSPDRVQPPCEYAGICGGCSLQHFDTRAQLRFKNTVLQEKLEHELKGATYENLEPIDGPVLGYRQKARLAVRYVHKKEQVLIGFREKGSGFITNMDSCKVLAADVSNLIPDLKKLIAELEGFRVIPQIEVAVGDSRQDSNNVALVVRHLEPLSEPDQDKLLQFAEASALDLYLQPKGNDSVHKIFPPDSTDRLYYSLPDYGLEMAFHPMDFTQVNSQINKKMLSKALELLELNNTDVVLDLFCGLGNFTLPLATLAAKVVGVEGSDEMVLRGQENATRNAVDNVEFYCADLFKPTKGLSWFENNFTKVLLDPPRSGALEVIPAIVECKPQRIVYVSCNPATLARDAAVLNESGYRLVSAGVMDMFPHTTHVESIALFVPERQSS